MDRKTKIVGLIVESLANDYAVLFGAAKSAHAAATHEENVPDNKYDTLSLEASYVAQGQANRAQEIKSALDSYRALDLSALRGVTAVRLAALVTLEDEGGAPRTVFLGPAAGGLKVFCDGEEVTVITPQSPLGRELLGKEEGDVVRVTTAGARKEYEIVAIV